MAALTRIGGMGSSDGSLRLSTLSEIESPEEKRGFELAMRAINAMTHTASEETSWEAGGVSDRIVKWLRGKPARESQLFLALQGDKLLGYAAVKKMVCIGGKRSRTPRGHYITFLAVHPDVKRQGVGSWMIQSLFNCFPDGFFHDCHVDDAVCRAFLAKLKSRGVCVLSTTPPSEHQLRCYIAPMQEAIPESMRIWLVSHPGREFALAARERGPAAEGGGGAPHAPVRRRKMVDGREGGGEGVFAHAAVDRRDLEGAGFGAEETNPLLTATEWGEDPDWNWDTLTASKPEETE